MGLDYSFELITERDRMEQLVRSVAAHLVDEDRERLLTRSPFTEPNLRNIRRDESEQRMLQKYGKYGSEQICFSFRFPLDERLAEYARHSARKPKDGHLAVGCVYTSVSWSSRFATVSAAAATTSMSLLFEQSESVRATFARIGQDAGASLVLLDDERPPDKIGIWPYAGRFSLGDALFKDDDAYVSALIAAAKA